MPGFTVLIVDPNGARRAAVARELQKRATVRIAATPAEAREAVKLSAPDVMVISLRQIEAHGLKLARELKVVAPDAWIMVFGTDPSMVEKRSEIAGKWGISRYEAREIGHHEIAGVVLALRRGNTSRIDSVALRAGMDRMERALRWERLREELFRHRDLIPTRPRGPHEPESVAEILNKPVSIGNLRLLVSTILGRQRAAA